MLKTDPSLAPSLQMAVLQQLKEAEAVLNNFLSEEHNLKLVAQAAQWMSHCLAQGGKIISCGNGGSHCDAMHFAEELSGRFRGDRKALAALAISDASHITCVGNDYGFNQIFSRYLEGLGLAGDMLLAISTSGNSENILNAVNVALNKGMQVVALTGKSGGALAELAAQHPENIIEIRVAHHGFADRIQEVHIKVIHILILLIEKELGLA